VWISNSIHDHADIHQGKVVSLAKPDVRYMEEPTSMSEAQQSQRRISSSLNWRDDDKPFWVD
jgi:hypothetical protein